MSNAETYPRPSDEDRYNDETDAEREMSQPATEPIDRSQVDPADHAYRID